MDTWVRVTYYAVRYTKYAFRGYVGTNYLVHVMWAHVTQYALRDMCYVLYGTLYVLYGYEVRATWISLYDFPPLAVCQGRFSCRKWFCFLDLKIKNDWSFHFRYSIFSGKGNKGEYL